MDPRKRDDLSRTFSKAIESAQQKGLQTFIGFKPPYEVEKLSEILSSNTFDKSSFRKILRFVVEYMKGTDITEQHWEKLKESLNINEDILSIAFSGALTIIKKATRNRVSQNVLKHDCEDVLKIPKEYVDDISQIVQNWKETIEPLILKNKTIHQPSLINLKWRVDVMIMSSNTERIFKPLILVQMIDSNGKIHTFEMSVSSFHNLRHQMEKLKEELTVVDTLPILQIDKPK